MEHRSAESSQFTTLSPEQQINLLDSVYLSLSQESKSTLTTLKNDIVKKMKAHPYVTIFGITAISTIMIFIIILHLLSSMEFSGAEYITHAYRRF